ncbi:PH domain-containing protein [Guggenheimella bovis]
MIDFRNASFMKLRPVNDTENSIYKELLLPDEKALQAFKSIRDMVVFTSKRIISINVQGITGKKKDFTSIPYSKIQTFSIETSGTFDLDTELHIWISGLGVVRFEFIGSYDITEIQHFIAERIL